VEAAKRGVAQGGPPEECGELNLYAGALGNDTFGCYYSIDGGGLVAAYGSGPGGSSCAGPSDFVAPLDCVPIPPADAGGD
jgi:hypothetical protein